jgi:hypothetical protein
MSAMDAGDAGDAGDYEGLDLEPVRSEVVDGLLVETFEVEIPADLYDGPDADAQRADFAIYLVRDECATYRVPAEYEAAPAEAGETVTVVRRSRAPGARPAVDSR